MTPASPAQAPLWLLQQLEPNSTAYNVAFHLDLEGPLDEPALERAWRALVERHDALRSTFLAGEDGPELVAQPADATPLVALTCSAEEAEAHHHAQVALPFELSQRPAVRAHLYRVAAERHTLGFVLHHAVFDGWSLNLLLEELAAAYAHELGEGPALGRAPQSFVEHAERTHRDAASNQHDAELAYWTRTLAGAPAELDLPRDHRRRLDPRPGATLRARRGDLGPALEQLAASAELTPFMVLLTAYAVLLGRYTGADEVVVGTPMTTRMRKKHRAIMGLFLNTVALRIRLDGAPTFLELAARVKAAALDALRHHQVPFDRVVGALHPERRPGQNPLFSTMFILQNAPVPYSFPRLDVRYEDDAPPAAKFDLTLSIFVEQGDLQLALEHATDRLAHSTAQGLLTAYQTLLASALEHPDVPVEDLAWLTPEDAATEAQRWVGARSAAEPTSLLAAVEAQVGLQPDAIAVTAADGEALTYRALWDASARMAAALRADGVGPGHRVGVRVPRDAHLPCTLLAVLRAGAAYIPLDPEAPAARRHAALEDARAAAVIVDREVPGEAPEGTRVLLREALDAVPGGALGAPGLDAPAYVIYTSGSSGRPKGVEIGHRALASFDRAAVAQVGLTRDDVVLATTTVGFDISVLELLTPLTVGARVHVVPREVAVDGQRLGEALDAAGVTVFQTTPSGLRLLLGSGWSGAPALKVLVGGEALPRDLALEARDRVAELHNVYGPTETTVWVTGRRVERAELEDGPDVVPIGGVFADTKLLVLDGRRRPVPPGGRGELYVAGPQVAQGYLHRPELDAERFVPDPTGSGARMYATGDVVRARTDGTLDFLGRADQQVKIRGFRVEPAEIETALRRQPGVRDAVVTTEARPHGLELVAFVVGVGPLVQDDLRSGLRQLLPGYMVPAAIHVVPHIPRGPSGKVDKRQLPKVSAPPPMSADAPAVAPHDRVEAQLLELWRALLGRRDVGLDDNFFDVGGHSMLAARLAAKVDKHLGQRLPVATFFQAQTVAEQAEVIRKGGAHLEWTALDPVKASGARVPLFYIGASDQARMLARHLPADQPMYALLVLGLPDEHSLEVDAVARTFVDEITTLQPEGPYAIAGYCQDAKLALAVARELQARGAKVARMIYVDVVWVPDLDRHARSQLKRNLVDMGPGYGLHWFEVRARHHVKRRSEQAWDRLMIARQARVGAEPPTTTVHRERLRALRANMARYPELPFEGDVDVILSQELHREGAARYLAHMAQGNLRVFEIPGVHQRMFEAPEVLWLASRLARCLEDTFSAGDT